MKRALVASAILIEATTLFAVPLAGASIDARPENLVIGRCLRGTADCLSLFSENVGPADAVPPSDSAGSLPAASCGASEVQGPAASGTGKRRANEPTDVSANTVAQTPEVRESLQLLDIWLEGQRLKDELPGMSVGVVYDQKLIWSKGYGHADVAKSIPTTDMTLYRIASLSKLFTATAVMRLVEAGKLSLEDPVAKHLSWFVPKDADPARPVLVWHLLTHTAGLRRETPGTDFDQLRRPDAQAVEAATRDTPLTLPPQTRQKYSNYAFQVAGLLVGELSGTPFPRYVEEEIFRPLGMTDSRLLDGDKTCPGLAVPYGRRMPEAPRTIESQLNNSGLLAAGGAVTSVRDLAKFASLQFKTTDDYAGPVLSGRSLRDMHRPRWLAPDWSRGHGIGWFLTRRDKTVFLGHGGSLPGYKSNLLIDPAGKIAVIVLINADDGPAGELARGIMGIVGGPIAKAAKPDETPLPPDPDLGRFEGLYRDRWGEYARVAEVGGKLRMIRLEVDDLQAATTTLERVGKTTFRTHVDELNMGGNVEDLLEFEVDAVGSPISFTVESGAYRYHRVK